MKNLVISLALVLLSINVAANDKLLEKAINGSHRTAEYVTRDVYRNPHETLKFFDVQPNHTVVEIWPGGGWYTEILAPYLKKRGKLIAAHYDTSDTQADYRPGSRKRFDEKMKSTPKDFGKVVTTSLMLDEKDNTVVKSPAAKESVDRVVTFRNAHGWYSRGIMDTIMGEFFTMLKPGGKLGLVQHQADLDQDWMSKNIGYVGREFIISSALKAGFELHAEGYFNNNPKDHKRYENGVWQLPPTTRGSEAEEQKGVYRSIGESDRMTLVFLKPE